MVKTQFSTNSVPAVTFHSTLSMATCTPAKDGFALFEGDFLKRGNEGDQNDMGRVCILLRDFLLLWQVIN